MVVMVGSLVGKKTGWVMVDSIDSDEHLRHEYDCEHDRYHYIFPTNVCSLHVAAR